MPENVAVIHSCIVGYRDVEGLCRVVLLDEIRENEFNLNIPRYVELMVEEELITAEEAVSNIKESLKAAYAAEDRLADLLRQEGLLS